MRTIVAANSKPNATIPPVNKFLLDFNMDKKAKGQTPEEMEAILGGLGRG